MNLTVFSRPFRWKGLEPRVLRILGPRGPGAQGPGIDAEGADPRGAWGGEAPPRTTLGPPGPAMALKIASLISRNSLERDQGGGDSPPGPPLDPLP